MSKKEQLFPYYRVRQNDLTYLQVKQKANKVKKQNNVFIFEKYIKCHFFHIMSSVADPENFGGGDLKHKTSKIRMSSPKLRVIFRPKSEIQTFFSPKFRWSPKKKKKRKKVFTRIETDFSPDSLRLGRWGGDASRNGAELFETEADFSAKIVTFRLVGGDAFPPPPPPP